LYWIAVDPAAQGRGIGHALLAQIESEARTRGARLVLIETSDLPAYAAARRLYETGGYRREAIVHDFYGPGDSLLIFAKTLESGATQERIKAPADTEPAHALFSGVEEPDHAFAIEGAISGQIHPGLPNRHQQVER
jgi:hypothetical protein